MPHVIVKMYPGRSDEQKAKLAQALTVAMTESLGCSDASLSIGIEDVAKEDWAVMVFEPDVTAKPATIYKKPGHTPG